MKRLLLLLILGLAALGAVKSTNASQFFCPSGNVTCLVAAITQANAKPGKDTINLQPGIYIVNNATGDGGAGLPTIHSSIRIQGSTDDGPTIIRRDAADWFISVFDVSSGGELTLKGITVQAPSAFGFGSTAISNQGTTTLENSMVSDSTGAIQNSGTLNVLRSIIANNFQFPGTGGILNDGGAVLVANSTIAHNFGGAGGSGAIENTGSLVVRGSAIVFNVSGGDVFNGPVIDNSGSVEIINSTVAKNFAAYGEVIGNGGVFSVTNSTVRENETFAEGAFPPIGWLAGTIEVTNTIVAGNNSPVCSGTITSLGNNLFDEPSSCSINLQLTDLTGDPVLGSLVGTGDDDPPGFVYYPVLAGSPVINSGNPDACPQTDQLGNLRDGVCDIGSIEFQSGTPVAIDIEPRDSRNIINLKGNRPIRVAILGTENFDASSVDPSTVRFGPDQAFGQGVQLRDVNGDGRLDLELAFKTQRTGVSCGDTSAFLSGQTFQQERIFGSDSVTPVIGGKKTCEWRAKVN